MLLLFNPILPALIQDGRIMRKIIYWLTHLLMIFHSTCLMITVCNIIFIYNIQDLERELSNMTLEKNRLEETLTAIQNEYKTAKMEAQVRCLI